MSSPEAIITNGPISAGAWVGTGVFNGSDANASALRSAQRALGALAANILLLTALGTAAAAARDPALENPDDLLWHYRVLLLRAPATGSAVAALQSRASAFAERDLLWFVFHDEGLTSSERVSHTQDFARTLRARLAAAGVRVLLIGKDGGNKLAADDLDLEQVLARIDAMPMRRREMRRRELRERKAEARTKGQ